MCKRVLLGKSFCYGFPLSVFPFRAAFSGVLGGLSRSIRNGNRKRKRGSTQFKKWEARERERERFFHRQIFSQKSHIICANKVLVQLNEVKAFYI